MKILKVNRQVCRAGQVRKDLPTLFKIHETTGSS
jgi:hypothetical protein